ncbi:hypothetical protein AAVH_38310 [Aphelenchoides avenae]|nr:hypothetical protein AAVH_38310 [Aphelenchus avenae]
MKLDNGTLQRFRESGIHCISLLHADHAFTANGVQNFFFSGSSVTEGVRSLDIGSGCKPIKRLTPAFVHYFVKTNLLANARCRLRLTAQVGDVRFNVLAYERQLVSEGGTTKIALNGLTVYLPTDANPTVRILS